MIQHELEITKISFVTVVLSIITATVTMKLFEILPENLPLKIGIISTIVSAFWFIYDKYLWKYRFFRLCGWLSSTPDINGRWEGTIDRYGENKPHKIVIEIKQTFSSIKYYVYSKNSNGESLTTKFIKDELGGKYKLISTWRSRGRELDRTTNNYEEFYGMSVMDYCEYDKSLNDFYFTNRNPQTKGTVKVSFTSKKLQGRF